MCYQTIERGCSIELILSDGAIILAIALDYLSQSNKFYKNDALHHYKLV